MQEMKLESIKRLNGKGATKAVRRGASETPSNTAPDSPGARSCSPSHQPTSSPGPPFSPTKRDPAGAERRALLQRRERFEGRADNCGGWERAFPCADAEAAATYALCTAAARAAFESHHSRRLRAHLDSLAARHIQQARAPLPRTRPRHPRCRVPTSVPVAAQHAVHMGMDT